MIETFKTIDAKSFAAKLEAFRRGKRHVRYDFAPGLNILFGPNGCGKSTMLRALAGYSFVDPRAAEGWTAAPRPIALPLDFNYKTNDYYDVVCDRFSPVRAEIAWSGSPTFFCDFSAFDGKPAELGMTGLLDVMEEMMLMRDKSSGGEKRWLVLKRALDRIERPPDVIALAERGKVGVNDVWRDCADAFIRRVLEIRNDFVGADGHKITALLDEPDKNLSVLNQSIVWDKIHRWCSNAGVQVIASSHSPFALIAPGAKMHDMIPGYVDECLSLFKRNFCC
jgi:hypothetical protein